MNSDTHPYVLGLHCQDEETFIEITNYISALLDPGSFHGDEQESYDELMSKIYFTKTEVPCAYSIKSVLMANPKTM